MAYVLNEGNIAVLLVNYGISNVGDTSLPLRRRIIVHL